VVGNMMLLQINKFLKLKYLCKLYLEVMNATSFLNHKSLTLPTSALPIVIIKGADHDSRKAAVLRAEFTESVERIIKFASVN
jgi:hypothetical protein